jgi:hypothetical protein
VGRVWPRHGGGGRPLNSVVSHHVYVAIGTVIALLLLIVELRAWVTVRELSRSWTAPKRLLLWATLLGSAVASICFIGLAEYPLPFIEGGELVTGAGFPVLALATVHKAHSVLDLVGWTTAPAIFADLVVSALLPVWVAALWLRSRDG